jgi:hypothetical protein
MTIETQDDVFAMHGLGRIASVILTGLFAVLVGACSVLPPPPHPGWVQARIAGFERLPVANPPRAILRFVHAGRTVYYVTSTCCDIPSELYEESGQLLCFPGGGFAGGDGRCPGVVPPANAVTVWRDTRAALVRPTVPTSK